MYIDSLCTGWQGYRGFGHVAMSYLGQLLWKESSCSDVTHAVRAEVSVVPRLCFRSCLQVVILPDKSTYMEPRRSLWSSFVSSPPSHLNRQRHSILSRISHSLDLNPADRYFLINRLIWNRGDHCGGPLSPLRQAISIANDIPSCLGFSTHSTSTPPIGPRDCR